MNHENVQCSGKIFHSIFGWKFGEFKGNFSLSFLRYEWKFAIETEEFACSLESGWNSRSVISVVHQKKNMALKSMEAKLMETQTAERKAPRIPATFRNPVEF
jgi:hypothetical protein